MIDPKALLIRADDEFEAAWRQRNWSAFVYLWLRNSAIVTVATFIFVGVCGIFGVEVTRIYYLIKGVETSVLPLYAGLWNYATSFTIATAIMCLFSGLLFMIVKEVCGDFSAR
jgi:hypothetical protein